MSRRYLLYGTERYVLAILRPLQEAIRARGDEVAWFLDGPGRTDLVPGERLLETVEAVKAWAPRAVFTPSDVVPPFFPGAKVEVFHGFDAGKPRHVHVRGLFDLYCTTGPRDTRPFSALAGRLGHFAVRETGWPKLDPFFRAMGEGPPPPVRERPVVLYHSTFSPSWSAAERLHGTVRDLSRTGRWSWVVTLHPKMARSTVEKFRALEGEHLRYADDDNILDLFPQADVMVSDTSSALSEFLLTGKPVVTFKNRRPGPQLIDIADPAALEPSITRALARPADLVAAIRAFGEDVHPRRDGRAAERVLEAADAFVDAGGRNRRAKPLNLWRKFRIRWKLGYWGR